MPPTLVAAESVPSVLVGVLVEALPVLPPHALSSAPPTSSAASAKEDFA